MNSAKFSWVVLFLMGFTMLGQSQMITIRGFVFDKASHQPLPGVNVTVVGGDVLLGTNTDANGNFELSGALTGRKQFEFSYVGYQTQITDGIIITAQRIPFLEIGLEEGVLLEGVQIVADGNANAPINELATVSARSFSVEETERIAASVNDMGRMALSFPGVQQGGDDTENDIIIRGNSSVGMLWRLEGIDIPNPNHFARPGTSGGGITVFSSQLLSKSDFYTGGMPAEFGNAISGAFDVHFRKGNMLDRQHRVRIGLLGLDFATEGPLSKGKSSYLINYRYSTLGLLNKMGFHLVGERVSNDFQDLSFNLAFDGKKQGVKWTLFGIGGLSTEHYTPVELAEERDPGIANHWEDRVQGSNMACIGATYTQLFGDKSYLKGTVAVMSSYIFRQYDTLSLTDARFRYNTQDYNDSRISTSWSYRKEFTDQWMMKAGAILHGVDYTFFKETAARGSVSDITGENRDRNLDGQGLSMIGQVYALAQYAPVHGLDINAGWHALYLGINGNVALDPRLSMKYSFGTGHQLGLAIGKYSQTLPLAAYFYEEKTPDGSNVQPNFEAPFLRSNHYILSYTYVTKNLLKFNSEVYFQKLSNVPVLANDTEGYWMLNNQADFPEQEIVSEGKGENYGIDLDIEKFFSNNFYFLLTASFFDSDFILANEERYPTKFATRWVSGLTMGREFPFKNKSVLQVGGRVMYNGGFRYTPFDPVLSAAAGKYVPQAGAYWTGQVSPYFRIDARLSYRYSKKKWSGNISLDIQNVTSHKNQNRADYNAAKNELRISHYPGGDFIPVLAFTFDF